MKNSILLFGLLLSFILPSKAQMTLAHTFSGSSQYVSEVVNLSISGEKIAVLKDENNPYILTPDTIFYYNMDYSFWKQIPCPHVSGYYGFFYFMAETNLQNEGVGYSSENLFDESGLLEAAVWYPSDTNSSWGEELIINENGVLVDSILDVWAGCFSIHTTPTGSCIATVSTGSGIQVYNLPGTIPCNTCGGGLGLAKTHEKANNILSAPIPNPSKSQVKITFTLPNGATRGQLAIYTTDGQLMTSYTVDNHFEFIMVDDSQFAPGTYYYNLTVNGQVSSTQKMVVIR